MTSWYFEKSKCRWLKEPIATARTTNTIKVSGTIGTNYQADELITQATTGAQGRVIEFDATNKILYYAQEKYTSYGLDTNKNLTAFSTNAAVTGGSSSASYSVDTGHSATTNGVVFVGGYATPELDRDSGEVICRKQKGNFKSSRPNRRYQSSSGILRYAKNRFECVTVLR